MALDFITHKVNSNPERMQDMREEFAVRVDSITFKTTDDSDQNYNNLACLLREKHRVVEITCCAKRWNWYYFKEHVKYAHRKIIVDSKNIEKEVVACPACTNCYANMSLGKDHIATHSQPDLFKCPFCKANFDSATYLKRHFPCQIHRKPRKKSHSKKQTISIPVSSDEESDDNNDQIIEPNQHMIQYAREKVDAAISLIRCDNQPLSSWSLAINHFSKYHSVIKSQRSYARKYECPDCKSFYNSITRAVECYLVSKNNEIFTCTRCQNRCNSREDYLQHCGVCTVVPNNTNQQSVNLVTGSYFQNVYKTTNYSN